ncbi:hypothetical protein M0805_003999 [Coniferiporia weirii]|nr:hypothetical protein M0805_003999 [Coniferiporia weirii]
MFNCRLPSLVLLGLALVKGGYAQTNVSIALGGFDASDIAGLNISGEIIGTGSDGTTYVISASGTDTGDVPFTMTVVQDATHVSEALSLGSGLGENAECTYNAQGVGACTLVIEGAGTGTESSAPETSVVTGTVLMVAVPVTTAPTPSPSATQGQKSGSSGNFLNAATIGLSAALSIVCIAFFYA